jgi:hypothetical protein
LFGAKPEMEVSVMSKARGVLRVVLLAAAFLSVSQSVRAETTKPTNTGVVDCGSPGSAVSCAECCSGSCGLRISCCPLSGPCTIKPGGPPSTGPLSLAFQLKLAVAGLNLQFQRQIKSDGSVNVKLKGSFIKGTFPQTVNAKVKLTGSDAQLAGLVWPVAFLGMGDGAGSALSTAGISASIEGAPTTCQAILPAQVCTDMAVGLAHHIQGGLGVAEKDDLNRFLDAVNGMGLGPCNIIF